MPKDYKDLPSTGNREREAAATKKSHIDTSKPKKTAPKKKAPATRARDTNQTGLERMTKFFQGNW